MTASSRTDEPGPPHTLTEAQIQQFIIDGFVRVESAFPRELAQEARSIFWHDLRAQGCLPDDRNTWTRPVIRLGMYEHKAIVAAANTPRLHAAFDQLVGRGYWRPCMSMGTLPVRFPSPHDPGDTGWHVDASFGFDDEKADFMDWRINIHSRGRALLMLFLFSDVGEDDAPTRIRTGSHRDIARALASAGESGLSLRDLILPISATSSRAEKLAIGPAGTVYLCHPFLVHSAQMHHGREPRFLAQPPLLPVKDCWLDGSGGPDVPVAWAIRAELSQRQPRP